MKYLVTGAAGFIGSSVSMRLLKAGFEVIGLDNLNEYYDVSLKLARLELLKPFKNFRFEKIDLANAEAMNSLMSGEKFQRVIHLGAQAGVRYSMQNPQAYVDSNITGFLNILEGCRKNRVEHLVFASTSSVYGSNTDMPFSEHQNVDHPLSFYAATKKANEVMAHSHSHLYSLPVTGLRFFTVYGPWGRPDMALFLFTKAILEGKPIDIFNHGKMKRDFTYIEDISESVVRVSHKIPMPNLKYDTQKPDPAISKAPYRIFNIGNHQPVDLMYFISCVEKELGVSAKKNLLPMHPGDVPETNADVSELTKEIQYTPATPVEEGIRNFISWYRAYYKV